MAESKRKPASSKTAGKQNKSRPASSGESTAASSSSKGSKPSKKKTSAKKAAPVEETVSVKEAEAPEDERQPARTSVRGITGEAGASRAIITRAESSAPKHSISPNKPLPRDFLIELGRHIRDFVLPHVSTAKGREVVGVATSGDATFKLDKVAEKALLQFLKEARLPVAYYSEDSGYTTFTSGQPQHLLVIDPIDGTRAAKSGFESCVVSVASTRVIERPTMADVENGCIVEIMGNRTFYAERGKGARIYQNGKNVRPKLSELRGKEDLEMLSWSMTVPARPAELIFGTAAKFIDLTTLKGGFFACNSTSFSLTRLLTNQLDACVDFANRFLRDIPSAVEDHFINAGRGSIMGIAPYDIAASVLIAQEAGCVVTDAYGKSFDEVLLLDTAVANQQSLIAAANAELHELLMQYFDKRIRQYEQLLKRREAALARS